MDRDGEKSAGAQVRRHHHTSGERRRGPLHPDAVLDLQRRVGNRATTLAVQRAGNTPTTQPTDALAGLTRGTLLRRLTKGPLLTDAEVAAIQAATDTTRLGALGLVTHADATAYLDKHKYGDWLEQPPGARLLIATLAWRRFGQQGARREDRITPAYTLGRALRLRRPEGLSDVERRAIEGERDDQIREAFVNTLVARVRGEHQGQVDRARDVLTRVFLILQSGLQVYEKGPRPSDKGRHVPYLRGDVARALAHGGRVNIRIPAVGRGEDPKEMSRWLGLTDGQDADVNPAERRQVGTHRMSVGYNLLGRGKFRERGGFWTGADNLFRRGIGKMWKAAAPRLYGIDLAADGAGRMDFNNDVITPDGGHGHLFVNFQPPGRLKDGALQVGIETTAPKAASPVGYRHDYRSTEATANPESSFYGHKEDKIGTGKLADNQRLVELGDGWLAKLQDAETEWNGLLDAVQGDQQGMRQLYEELVGRRGGRFDKSEQQAEESRTE
ncbi:PE-PGRS family protein [Actinophytocola oryzae]|nr:PE-PGRS family protein [Actinophytocola oryzae]